MPYYSQVGYTSQVHHESTGIIYVRQITEKLFSIQRDCNVGKAMALAAVKSECRDFAPMTLLAWF